MTNRMGFHVWDDLDRTVGFYRKAGMEEFVRYEGYLLMGLRLWNCTSRPSLVEAVPVRP